MTMLQFAGSLPACNLRNGFGSDSVRPLWAVALTSRPGADHGQVLEEQLPTFGLTPIHSAKKVSTSQNRQQHSGVCLISMGGRI